MESNIRIGAGTTRNLGRSVVDSSVQRKRYRGTYGQGRIQEGAHTVFEFVVLIPYLRKDIGYWKLHGIMNDLGQYL
jgi:hypothetical protein